MLDLSAPDFVEALDERFPGFQSVALAMSGKDSGAQDMVSRTNLGDVSLKVRAADGETEVFNIDVAKAAGRPTLRIGKKGATVQMSVRLVGAIARALLPKIDDYIGSDIVVDIATLQTTIDEVSNGKTKRRGKSKSIAIVEDTDGAAA